jgi:hypothetical protein
MKLNKLEATIVLREPSDNETVNKIDQEINAAYAELHKIKDSLEKLQKSGKITNKLAGEINRDLRDGIVASRAFRPKSFTKEEAEIAGPIAYQLMRKYSENIRRQYETK